jgi:Ca2+-binding EF-hand superfamily protein
MSSFVFHSRFRTEILMILVSHLKDSELVENKKAFYKFDTDFSGSIDFDEMVKTLDNEPTKMTRSSMTKLYNAIDFDDSGEIGFSEFTAASLADDHLSEKNLKSIFNYLDRERNGHLTPKGLVSHFRLMGKKLSAEEARAMFDEVGVGEKMTYERFADIMTQ